MKEVEEDKLEPTVIVVTEDMFKLKNTWSNELVWMDSARTVLLEALNAHQAQYWLGDNTHPDRLLSAASSNQLPVTVPVLDKFGRSAGVPEKDYQKVVNPWDNPFAGGNSAEIPVPKGF